jgi:hypothetical protein
MGGGGMGGGGSSGAGGAGGGAAGAGGSAIGGASGVCQGVQLSFQPVTPTVYLLAQRSGSMFRCLSSSQSVCPTPSDSAWGILKEAARSVVGMVDAQVRFGFATAWGTSPAQGGTCPSLQGSLTDAVAPALASGTAIMAKYDSLPPPSETQTPKFESPLSPSEKVVGQTLGAINNAGEKYILLITDGHGDYCDDAIEQCSEDSMVWRIQANRAAGITTIVLGVESAVFNLPPGLLQAYANAGAGEPTVAALPQGQDTSAFYDLCSGTAGWRADRVESGKPDARGTTLGTYAATAGPSRFYAPNANDEAALAARLKSCRFNLSGNVKVDTTKLNTAHIKIAGADIPLDATDGWSMPTDTQVLLNGAACATWRTPGHDAIDFQFPCAAIIVGP